MVDLRTRTVTISSTAEVLKWRRAIRELRPTCRASDHEPPSRQRPAYSPSALERAAELFRALGDPPRLRVLEMLSRGELCVSQIVRATREKFPTVSQRLRLLRAEGLVARRREGTHVYYALADRHVAGLIHNALAHAAELRAAPPPGHHQGD